jgi:hypothetical protein
MQAAPPPMLTILCISQSFKVIHKRKKLAFVDNLTVIKKSSAYQLVRYQVRPHGSDITLTLGLYLIFAH